MIGCYKILLSLNKRDLYYQKIITIYKNQKRTTKIVHWTLEWMDQLIIKKKWEQAEKICLEALDFSNDNLELLEKLEKIYSCYQEEKSLGLWMRLRWNLSRKTPQLEKAAEFYRKAYDRFLNQDSLLALVAVLIKLGRTKEGIAFCFKAAYDALQKAKIEDFNTYVGLIEANDPKYTMLDETQKVTLVAHRQINELSRKLNEVEQMKNHEINLLNNQLLAANKANEELSHLT